jgi:hypothetical protein
MWFLVQVVKGSKHFESESQVGNQVLISDTTDMVISCRNMGEDGCRFEARRGSESYVMQDFAKTQPRGSLGEKFKALAHKLGAVVTTGEA